VLRAGQTGGARHGCAQLLRERVAHVYGARSRDGDDDSALRARGMLPTHDTPSGFITRTLALTLSDALR
jgi:hypothetical protein